MTAPRDVLVTGGARGLGAAVVDRLAADGAQPWVLDHVAIEHPRSRRVDLRDRAATEAAVGEVVDTAGGLDAVVTCAGVDVPGRLADVDPDDWERVLQVNLLGTVNVVRAALPALEARRGRIVTVASTLGHRAVSDATAYCASKAGVVGFTRALMAELKGRIGVTLLSPGGMATSFFDGRDEQYRPGPDAVLADPADVAAAVAVALAAPPGCELKELVVGPGPEVSWP